MKELFENPEIEVVIIAEDEVMWSPGNDPEGEDVTF